ncbi:hypothetical protein AMTR_s00033p00229160 [Amborella trichopoda]|uniref:Uncharacterized protein n=1 Tax=Amborella trichopoda TaxID=13333 RepID=U5CZ11_AMBTC|nr:hypothetical protein AMTR_s00033p00229160 [Amborella trichopoda]
MQYLDTRFSLSHCHIVEEHTHKGKVLTMLLACGRVSPSLVHVPLPRSCIMSYALSIVCHRSAHGLLWDSRWSSPQLLSPVSFGLAIMNMKFRKQQVLWILLLPIGLVALSGLTRLACRS